MTMTATSELYVGNATMGSGTVPATWVNHDPALSTWSRNHSVSRDELLRVARAKLTRLLSLPVGWDGHHGKATRPVAVAVLNGVLDRLVDDDSATPQIAPLSNGGVQVEWLVAGDSLQVHVSPEGDVVLFAVDEFETEIVDGEFYYSSPDVVTLDLARAFLHKISPRLEYRLSAS